MVLAKRAQFKFLFASSIICIFELTACGIISPKPSLSNIKTCETLNSQGTCQDDLSTFKNKNQKLFVSADLEHVPQNASIKVEWKYFSANQQVPLTTDTVEVKKPNNFVVSSLSSPDQGFPPGKFTVTLTLPESENSNPYVKEFTMVP
jgi:hypothetical protein